jgi:hypothetical protein
MSKMSTDSRNTFLVCATVMFCTVIAGALGVLHYVKDPQSSIALISILFGLLAPSITGIAAVIGINNAKQAAKDAADVGASVKEDTHAILNGAMEAKIQKVVAKALIDHSIETHPDDGPKKRTPVRPK